MHMQAHMTKRLSEDDVKAKALWFLALRVVSGGEGKCHLESKKAGKMISLP